jgi:CheY-like chemotaxis protein
MKSRLCVFVVDDDPDYCKGTGLLLKSLGHDAETFTEAEALLAVLATRIPDVILSDIGMPRIDGCELARHVRERPDCRRVILAAVTGHGEEDDRRRAVEAGFDFRFVKPFAANELRDFLEQLQTRTP